MSDPGAVGRRPAAEGTGSLLPPFLLALVCAGYAVGTALGWGSSAVALVMSDFGLSAAAFAAAASCLHYARTRAGRFRPAWLLFALSSAMTGLGNAVWGWHEVVLGRPVPSPSVADYCFLLFAPPAIVGLLVLAKRPVTRAGWACLALDGWLIGGSLLTTSWSLALAHSTALSVESVAGAALSLAYPLLDIVLVSMALVLHFRSSPAHRPATDIAVAAFALTVLCDALFTSPLLHGSYRSGHILDAGWFTGSVLLAYAPWAPPREAAHDGDEDGRDGVRRAPHRYPRPLAGSLAVLTPYLAVGVCTLGVLHNILEGLRVDRMVLFTGSTVLLALVVRQGLMLFDNIALTQELARQENHFRSLVQGSSDVIMIAAPTGVLRYVSPAAAGVYGTAAEELVGTELAALVHPEDRGAVVREVRRFLYAPPDQEPTTRIECRFRAGGHRADGARWLNVESTVNRHHGGLIFNSRDVTERVRLQARLQHSAEHDPLTDLPNRALFTRRVQQVLGGRRGTDPGTAVLFVDLDGFKAVNDRLGHQAGDELLVHAARRLRQSLRAGDTAARLGGDEFAALVPGDGTRDPAARRQRILEIAERLCAALSRPYPIEGAEARVAASIGVAFAEPGITPAALMRHADRAMYRAKAAGKGRVELCAPQQLPRARAGAAARTALPAPRLPEPRRQGDFTLLHQPVVSLVTGRIRAVTAQAHGRSAPGPSLPPAGAGRAAGVRSAELGRRLLEKAAEQAAERHRAGYRTPVAVRLPARSLLDPATPPPDVEAVLARYALPPGALVLEVADSDPLLPLDELERRLTALRGLGVLIALGGLGDGPAPFGLLLRLPFDVLRLDRALVEGVDESARLRAVTSGLLRIAADLGMRSVADGVDLPEQVVALRAMGCTHGQGMAFSEPLDERRTRRALERGAYPVPCSGDPRRTLLAGAARPVRRGGAEDAERRR